MAAHCCRLTPWRRCTSTGGHCCNLAPSRWCNVSAGLRYSPGHGGTSRPCVLSPSRLCPPVGWFSDTTKAPLPTGLPFRFLDSGSLCVEPCGILTSDGGVNVDVLAGVLFRPLLHLESWPLLYLESRQVVPSPLYLAEQWPRLY